MRFQMIEAVLKVVERCNINCSYCYMYNKGSEVYKERPTYMSENIARQVAAFIAQGARDLSTKHVSIVLHGGEPLMIRKERFSRLCEILEETIEPVAPISFGVQTNAMLVDDDWIRIFSRHRIQPGVSIDGPPEYHNSARVDHRGRGTYDAVVAGLQKLQKAAAEGLLTRAPGVICVINPTFSAKRIFHHFVDDLGVTRLNFLLPDDTHDTADPTLLSRYGDFICELFDEWMSFGHRKVEIRLFSEILSFMMGGQEYAKRLETARESGLKLISIASNGDIEPDDNLRPAHPERYGRWNVSSTSLVEFLNTPLMRDLRQWSGDLPEECLSCSWQNTCRGGATNGRLVNRYSERDGFKRKSVICDSIRTYHAHIAAHLLKSGFPFDRLREALEYVPSDLRKPAILESMLSSTA